MRRIKFIACLLSVIMTLNPAIIHAESQNKDISEKTEESQIQNESADHSDAELSIQEVIRKEINELDSMESGVDYVQNEAVFHADSREEAEETARQYGGELIDYGYGVATLKFDEDIKNVLGEAIRIDSVETAIEPNYIAEIDTYEIDSTGSTDTTYDPNEDLSGYQSWYKEKINLAGAEGLSGDGIKVAVIDTGADLDHSDLEDNIKESTNVMANPENTDGDDNNSHGTHVSGIIAADDDGKGITGIAPNADLYIIKAAGYDGKLTSADISKGIHQAMDYGVDVINMSFSTTGDSDVIRSAIDDAINSGIVCVSTAGNKGVDTKAYPAAYDDVFAVGSSTAFDTLSNFSNYGDWVELTAPGGESGKTDSSESIFSDIHNNSFKTKNGTSQAAPMVAATAALVLQSGHIKSTGRERVEDVREAILKTLDDKTYSYGGRSIMGGLDAGAAVKYIVKRKQEPTEQKEEEQVRIGEELFTIIYTSSVSYDGRKHVSSDKKETKNKAADIDIFVSVNGEYLTPDQYKIKFKNNKNAASDNSAKGPKFYVILKGKNFSKETKKIIKAEACDFSITPCDLSTAYITYKSTKITRSGAVKISGLKYINPLGKKIALRGKGKKASYYVTTVSDSSIIIDGTGNFIGRREIPIK